MKRRRIVFKEPVSFQDFAQFAESQGWRYEGGSEATDEEPEEYVWLSDDGSELHWLNDPVLRLEYVLLIGEQPFDWETKIRIAFDSYAIEDAVREFVTAKDWEDRGLALRLVSATAPEEFNQETFDAIVAGLNEPSELVRRMAVLAVFYAQWAEFLPILNARAVTDPDDEVRRTATIAVDTIRTAQAGGRSDHNSTAQELYW
jgi:hypothetical protein